MAQVCKPFNVARIGYFDTAASEAVKAWLAEA
jgi:hypothetical protein